LTIDLDLQNFIKKMMLEQKITISVAESCTGGFLSMLLTSIAGSSHFFKGSMVTYSNDSKINLLGINPRVIKQHGVVSQCVAESMANKIREKYDSDYGIATTGYVDVFQNKSMLQSSNFHAWIAISNISSTISKCLILNNNRLQNISDVSHQLLSLLRKEIT